MEEVLVDIIQHPSTGPEVMECALDPLGIRSALRGSDRGMGDGNLEQYGSFLVCNGCLCDQLVREGVMPGKCDLDFGES